MKIDYPDHLDDFNLKVERQEHNESSHSRTVSLADAFYALQGLENVVGAKDLADEESLLSRVASLEARINSSDLFDVTLNASGANVIRFPPGTVLIIPAATIGVGNKSYNQEDQPDRAQIGDEWYQPSSKLKRRFNGGAWEVVGNAYDNTDQLTDGAGLGNTALWSGVSGKPDGAVLLVNAPAGDGLYIDGTHLGYYKSGNWTTYMDSSGNFGLIGSSSAHGLTWTASTNLLKMTGGTFESTNAGDRVVIGAGNRFIDFYSGTNHYVLTSDDGWRDGLTVTGGDLIAPNFLVPGSDGIYTQLGNGFVQYRSGASEIWRIDTDGDIHLTGEAIIDADCWAQSHRVSTVSETVVTTLGEGYVQYRSGTTDIWKIDSSGDLLLSGNANIASGKSYKINNVALSYSDIGAEQAGIAVLKSTGYGNSASIEILDGNQSTVHTFTVTNGQIINYEAT